jgi:hypothetical protein
MSSVQEPHLHLEVGHILFLDIVGYSKLLSDEQKELVQELNQIVRETEQFRAAEAEGKPTRFTDRRWHAIQTLPRPPRSLHAIDYRDTGSSLLWRQRN